MEGKQAAEQERDALFLRGIIDALTYASVIKVRGRTDASVIKVRRTYASVITVRRTYASVITVRRTYASVIKVRAGLTPVSLR